MDVSQIDPGRAGASPSSLVSATGTSAGALAPLDALGEQARAYLDAARSANTHRAYRADWQHFTGWCAEHELGAAARPRPRRWRSTSPTTLAR